MTEPTRYQQFISRDPIFWSPSQQAALELACGLAGVEPTIDEAWHWKRQSGEAFKAWRSVSRSRRKSLIRSAVAEER